MMRHGSEFEQSTGYQVVMPRLGLTMTEATLTEWHQPDGAVVEKGQALFTLETEKSTLEIEAPASGTLRILVAAGEVVPVNTPIALIGGKSGELAPGTPTDAEVGNAHSRALRYSGVASTTEEPELSPVRATPKARALARQDHLALACISGTGMRGMIVAADVKLAASKVRATPVARHVARTLGIDLMDITGTGRQGLITRADVEQVAGHGQSPSDQVPVLEPAPAPDQPSLAEPLTGLRAVIAQRLSESWRERPQVTLVAEADATHLVATRQQLLEEQHEKVAHNAFLAKAIAVALSEHRYLNVKITEAGVVKMTGIHIGVAVDTERGLLVPVIRDADTKSVLSIHHELVDLTRRALAGRCQPDELVGSTFTLTNLGMFEVELFTPIINPPESAILGVGSIVARPVVIEGQITVRQRMMLCLAFDHRVTDGAPAARFLQRLKQLIERPAALLTL